MPNFTLKDFTTACSSVTLNEQAKHDIFADILAVEANATLATDLSAEQHAQVTEQVATLCELLGDEEILGDSIKAQYGIALIVLSTHILRIGDFAKGFQYAERGIRTLDAVSTIEEKQVKGKLYVPLVFARHYLSHDEDTTRREIEAGLVLLEETPEVDSVAKLLTNLAVYLDPEDAYLRYTKAIDNARNSALHDRFVHLVGDKIQAMLDRYLQLSAEHLAEIPTLLGEAETIAKEHIPRRLVQIYDVQAHVAAKEGNYQQALTYFKQAYDLCQQTDYDDQFVKTYTEINYAEGLAWRRRFEDAETVMMTALESATDEQVNVIADIWAYVGEERIVDDVIEIDESQWQTLVERCQAIDPDIMPDIARKIARIHLAWSGLLERMDDLDGAREQATLAQQAIHDWHEHLYD